MISRSAWGKMTGLALTVACLLNSQVSLAAEYEKKIRIAYYVGKGVGKPRNLSDKLKDQDDMELTFMNGIKLRASDLRGYDVIVVPGGLSKLESRSMAREGREELRRFVKEGGCYLGICAGCYLGSCSSENDLDLFPLRALDTAHWRRGETKLDLDLTPEGMEIFGREKPHIKVIYHNGPVLGWKDDQPDPHVKVLGRYLNEIVAPGGEPGIMRGAPSMVYTRYGAGRVIGCSPHTEKTPGLENMLPHAIRWMVQQQRESRD